MAEMETPVETTVEKVLTPLEQFSAYLQSKHKYDMAIALDELAVTVPRDALHGFIQFLRDDAMCDFHQLMDVTATDFPQNAERFELVYNLLSMTKNRRIRIKTTTDEATPVDSIADLYPTANWFEREVWDMYGVYFNNHPDLRRILTDYGFEGYPLRKDFPLTGYVELRYDQQQKRCVYEPVKLQQDFRSFDFLSPWEGLTDVMLPGDEKAVKPKFMPDEKK